MIWVTNLNADGPGSLREAIATRRPRIVRFKVAGTIELRRQHLRVGGPPQSPICAERAIAWQGRRGTGTA